MAARPFTELNQQAFLRYLTECGNVTASAKAVRVSKRHLYRLKAQDPAFAEAWQWAHQMGIEALEDEAIRRAFEGVQKPVYQNGIKVGTYTHYSDTLLIFLLKGGMPTKYRNRLQLATREAHTKINPSELTSEQIQQLEAILQRVQMRAQQSPAG
jgi:hypothetical protein